MRLVDQRPSVRKFIPVGLEEPRVLIHLLSLIFLRVVSFLHNLSMIITVKSASEWPSLLNARPLVTLQLFHGQCRTGVRSFCCGEVGQFPPHTEDHTSCILLDILHLMFCKRQTL